MAKKKAEENPDGLTEEELAAEAEMIAADDEPAEVVAEEEAQGDEVLSTEEVEEPEKVDKPAEPNAAEPEPKPEPTTVPLAALDSERHKRKEAEGRLAVLEDKMTALTAPQAPAPDEMPDPVVDPEGFKGWLVRRETAASQPVQQMTAQMRQSQEQAELRQFATSSEAAFTVENTDYTKALEFARDLRVQEFRLWGKTEDQIPLLMNALEGQIAAEARATGKNPAEFIYNYAKLHGYKAAAPAEDAGDKITRLAAAQKTTQSTAGAGGTSREEEWTAERLAGLSDEEMANIPPDVFKRVMGG